jgi:hypothetical protein
MTTSAFFLVLALLSNRADRLETLDFNVRIRQATGVQDLAGSAIGEVRYEVTVTNKTDETWTIRKVSLQSAPNVHFVLPLTAQTFDRPLVPGEKTTLDVWASPRIHRTTTPDGRRHRSAGVRIVIDAVGADGLMRTETFNTTVFPWTKTGGVPYFPRRDRNR